MCQQQWPIKTKFDKRKKKHSIMHNLWPKHTQEWKYLGNENTTESPSHNDHYRRYRYHRYGMKWKKYSESNLIKARDVLKKISSMRLPNDTNHDLDCINWLNIVTRMNNSKNDLHHFSILSLFPLFFCFACSIHSAYTSVCLYSVCIWYDEIWQKAE